VTEDRFMFEGRVTDEGHVRPEHVRETAARLRKWKGRRVLVEVTRYVKRRTNNQLAWYWVAVVPAVADHLSRGRVLPLSKDQAHYVLKAAFIGQEETPLGPAPISTGTLSAAQFSEYVERIRAHAASEWGLNIPSPDEYWSET
jgi:hypothetical protein